MQYRCDNCGRLTKGPGVTEAPRKRYYCPECEKKIATQLLLQEAACRREMTKIWDELADATGRKIRIGMCVPAKQVLVYSGMVELAKLLGEEITVIEDHDGYWFQIWHEQVEYAYLCKGSLEEDWKVIKEWEKKHETF